MAIAIQEERQKLGSIYMVVQELEATGSLDLPFDFSICAIISSNARLTFYSLFLTESDTTSFTRPFIGRFAEASPPPCIDHDTAYYFRIER
jgi:hypothetical protein